jgi:predicted transcriptional regulator
MGLPVEGRSVEVPKIGQVARRDVPRATLRERMAEVRARVLETEWDTAMVVNEAGVLLGRLYKSQFDEELETPVEEVMEEGPSTFRLNVSVPEMSDTMRDEDLDTAPVTTSEGVLVGMVLRDDLSNPSS